MPKSDRLRAAVAEVLERRTMLSFALAGPEFPVNSVTANGQRFPAIAMDGDGDFVAVWQSNLQDGSNYGIYAQRFNALGVAKGAEFRVNTYTTNTQTAPAVAMDGDGDFVVVWDSANQDGNSNGIFAQRYNAAGVAQGGEFQVNTFITSQQVSPDVAMDAAGNFVIAWSSRDQDGNLLGVYAKRYDFSGLTQGAEFRVNSYTTGDQDRPAVAMNAAGNFIVAWQSFGPDGSTTGISAQRYNAAGAAQGTEFQVNTYTTSQQDFPAVAMNASGDFVVAWHSYGQDGEIWGIYAQRYNAAGAALGGEFQVNVFTTASQQVPTIAADAAGNFIIGWASGGNQDGGFYGIYARRYTAAGTALGGEFQVNTFTTNSQNNQAIGMDPAGDIVIAWQSNGQDGSLNGIYAQRYDESTDIAGPMIAGLFVNGDQVVPYGVNSGRVQRLTVSFSEPVSDTGGASGANSVTNPANWLATYNGTSYLNFVTYGFNGMTNRYEAVLNLVNNSALGTEGNFIVKARDNLLDSVGNALDGNADGVPGAAWVMPFGLPAFRPYGGEFGVNDFTTTTQTIPQIAMDAAGNFVVVWEDNLRISAKRFNAAGVAQGGEFQVNVFTGGTQRSPDVAMDAVGNFVVVWDSSTQDSGNFGVYARRFDAAGNALSSDIQVNTFITQDQRSPSVAMTPSGSFVVSFESFQDFGTWGVYGRRFDSAGNGIGLQFSVHTYTTGQQRGAKVAVDSTGNFVVAWVSEGQDGSGYGIYAQRYNAAGTQQGSEFRVNTTTSGSQYFPEVAMDPDGDFVVVWEKPNTGVSAQLYGAGGAAVGGEISVTLVGHRPEVAMDGNGEFLITYDSFNSYLNTTSAYFSRFRAAGTPRSGGGVSFNDFETSQFDPAVAIDGNGNAVFVWSSNGANINNPQQIFARRFLTEHTPTVASLLDSPDPVTVGTSIALSASGASDNSAVSSVSFYRESNGTAGLQVGAEGDTFIDIDSVPSGGVWSVNASTTGLVAGTYTYWAQATDDAGLTGPPASTTNTVTAGSLAVNASQLEFETRQAISITFNNPLNPATVAASDLAALNLDDASTPAAVNVILSAGNTVATWVFNTPGAFISNGDYQFTLPAGAVIDTNGNALNAPHQLSDATIFFMAGDANRDRVVDITDLGILATNWQQSPRVFSQGDFNLDSMVDITDLGMLATNWQKNLPALASRPPARASSRPTRMADLTLS